MQHSLLASIVPRRHRARIGRSLPFPSSCSKKGSRVAAEAAMGELPSSHCTSQVLYLSLFSEATAALSLSNSEELIGLIVWSM